MFRQVFSRLIRLAKGESRKLGYYHEEKAKMNLLIQSRDCSRHLILTQSRVPLYEKHITVIYALGSTHEENAV